MSAAALSHNCSAHAAKVPGPLERTSTHPEFSGEKKTKKKTAELNLDCRSRQCNVAGESSRSGNVGRIHSTLQGGS